MATKRLGDNPPSDIITDLMRIPVTTGGTTGPDATITPPQMVDFVEDRLIESGRIADIVDSIVDPIVDQVRQDAEQTAEDRAAADAASERAEQAAADAGQIAVGDARSTLEQPPSEMLFYPTAELARPEAAEHLGNKTRYVADSLSDIGNISDDGARQGGTDANGTVLSLYRSLGRVPFVPSGVFATGFNSAASLPKKMRGLGQVADTTGRRAPYFTQLSAPPSSFGDIGSVLTAFNGDLSGVQFPIEHRTTGPTTLGTPASGYVTRPETSAVYLYHYNSSGHNEKLDWTDGRTGVSPYKTRIFHAGQGDVSAFGAEIFVSSQKPGATHFLAQPAGTMFNGSLFAGADHVNLVVGEHYVKDNGHDINGTGYVVHMNRTNAAGAQEVFWRGHVVNSDGSQPIDAGYMVRGRSRRGFDTSLAELGTVNAAFTARGGQRFYLNATRKLTSSPTGAAAGYQVWDTYGDVWFGYDPSLNVFEVTRNVKAPQLVSSGVAGTNRAFTMQTGNVGRWRLTADGVTESGGNVGSNLALIRYADDGSTLGVPLYIERASGAMRIGEVSGRLSFYGQTETRTKPTILGSRGGSAALGSLLEALTSLGLVNNSTTA